MKTIKFPFQEGRKQPTGGCPNEGFGFADTVLVALFSIDTYVKLIAHFLFLLLSSFMRDYTEITDLES